MSEFEPLQLLCVIPGDLYLDAKMDVWRQKVCDASFEGLKCYVCEEELESLSSWFEKESNPNVIVHHDDCVEKLVPVEIFPVFNAYREIYKAEIEIGNEDRDSNDSRVAAEYRYLTLVLDKVRELGIHVKDDEE